MPSGDRRRALATTTVGLGGVAGGGVISHGATEAAQRRRVARGLPRKKFLPGRALLDHGNTRGRLVYGGGALLLAAGGAGAGTGLVGLRKRDDKRQRTFVAEGISGTQDALRAKREDWHSGPRDTHVRAAQAAAGIGGALVGSQAGHKGLDLARHYGVKVGGRKRAAISAVGGTLGGVAALPLANRSVRDRGYKITPTGVVRSSEPIKRPSTMATVLEGRPSRDSGRFGKALAVRVTGHKPYGPRPDSWTRSSHVLGAGLGHSLSRGDPYASAKEIKEAYTARGFTNSAGRKRRLTSSDLTHATNRQRNVTPPTALELKYRSLGRRVSKADIPAYGGRDLSTRKKAALTFASNSVPVVGDFAVGATAAHLAPPKQKAKAALTQSGGSLAGTVGGAYLGTKASTHLARRSAGYERAATHLNVKGNAAMNMARRAVGRTPRPAGKAAAAIVGGALGASALGNVGTGIGFKTNLNRERHWRKEQLAKLAPVQLDSRERKTLAGRKRRSATLSQVSGATGIGALSALALSRTPKVPVKLAARLRAAQTPLLTTGAGTGGINAFLGAGVQRKEASALSPEKVHKAFGPGAPRPRTALRPPTMPKPRTPSVRTSYVAGRRSRSVVGLVKPYRVAQAVVKLDTTMREDEARKIVGRYGLKGTLPHTLDRPTRMKAYEARYVSAGGPKGEKWGRRKSHADKVLGGSAITVGAAAGTELASRALRKPRLGHRASTIGLAATASGVPAYLASRHAEHKQASYRSTPAGVAASALRRMRDYDLGS